MATLRQIDGHEVRTLDSDTLVGRSSACSLRLKASDVSKEHAALNWTGEQWTIRDLNSRNGTFVDGRRLGPGERGIIEAGTQLGFGTSERWVCSDASPPQLSAATTDDQEPIIVSGQQSLAIYEGEELLASVSRDIQGRWVLERDEEVTYVRSGETHSIGGRPWQLRLPEVSATTDVSDGVRTVTATRLRLLVADDGTVHAQAHVQGEVIDLRRRGHHALLLGLARLRKADQAAGKNDFDAGWINYRKLQDLLDCTRNLINVNVHRARKQFEEHEFIDAGCLIERKQHTGKLRLGVSEVEILSES